MPTNKLMKRLSLYLFLIFFTLPTPSQADDIRDFQIEGISVGDSLLDHFSEEEIKKEIQTGYAYHYKNSAFVIIGLDILKSNLETYQHLSATIKPADPKYIIYALKGSIKFQNEINKCIKKRDAIVINVKNMFKNLKIKKKDIKHGYDDESLVYTHEFKFPNKDEIRIFCVDWVAKTEIEKGWSDGLHVSLVTWELIDFINKGGMK